MLDVMEIKNMTTEEMRNLLNKLTKELKFRDAVGEEIWKRRQHQTSCVPISQEHDDAVVGI